MTKQELNDYFWLKQEVECMENRIRELRSKAAAPPSARLTGMPHGSGVSDRVAQMAAEIVSLQEELEKKQAELLQEHRRIEQFIRSIPDSMTRLIFSFRCMEGMKWQEVAAKMGYRMSEENARQIYHRYLRKEEKRNGIRTDGEI